MYFAIRFYAGTHPRIIVPKAYEKEFQAIRSLSFGGRSCSVQCLTHRENDNFILISTAIQQQLNMPAHRMSLFHLKNDHLTITIPFGIFTAGFQKEGPLLGPRTKYFESLSETGHPLGYQALFFGHQHLSALPTYMTGYVFDRNVWRKVESPIPEVIYNRIPNRKTENHPKIFQALRVLKEKSHLFNPGFFNKATILKYIMESNQLDHLLPQTIFHPSEKMITDMLKKGAVYIKPSHGSRGEGLMRINQNENGTIDVLEADARSPHPFHDPKSFYQAYFPDGSDGYLIQPQIKLLETQKKPLDFRVHTNKDETGKWVVTVIGVRVGNEKQPTTHHTHGGSVHLLEEVFSDSRARQIKHRLETAALSVSKELDKHYQHRLGELGIDIGIDKDEALWLFEVNAKPGFFLFDHPILARQMNDYFSYIYRYGHCLMAN